MQAKVHLLVAIMLTSALTMKSISSQNVSSTTENRQISYRLLRIMNPPTRTIASVRERIVLNCIAMGRPSPTIYWLKDGVRMTQRNYSIIQYAYDKLPQIELGIIVSRLYLDCVTKKREAVYTCVAGTQWERRAQKHTVIVDTSKTLTNLPNCATQYKEGYPARIIMYTQTLFEFQGRNARLCCRFRGSPLPKHTWFDKHGEPIVDGIKYRLVKNGDLIIKELSDEDSGDYQCKVENKLGHDSILVRLTVDFTGKGEKQNTDEYKITTTPSPSENDTTETNKTDFTGKDEQNYRPTDGYKITTTPSPSENDTTETNKTISSTNKTRNEFLERLRTELIISSTFEDVTASVGAEIVLACDVKGFGNPTIYWLKNGVRLSQSNSSIIPKCAYEKLPKKELSQVQSKLYFNYVTEESSGLYTCVAETPIARNSLNFTVDVDNSSSSEDSSNCTTHSSIEFPARITMYTKFLFEYRNREARLYCRFDGNPLPNRTSWLDKDGMPIESGIRYRISRNGDLVIKKLSDDDGGFYRCTVQNQHGTAGILTLLTVETPEEERKNQNLPTISIKRPPI